jgi:hypothetical protein
MHTKQKAFRGLLITIASFVLGTGLGYLIAYFTGLNPTIIPLVSSVLALIIAFALPIWQTLFFNAPRLSVEISSIRRIVSDTTVISLDDYSELSVLKPLFLFPKPPARIRDMNLLYPGLRPERGNTIDELDELLTRAKQQLKELPAQIDEQRKDYEKVASISPIEFSKFDCDRLNRTMGLMVEFDPDNKEKTLEVMKEQLKTNLSLLEKRYTDLHGNLPVAERKLETIKKDLLDNRSFFTVSVSLINSGRTNTAIKVPALLRVSIGEGNYIDIKLTLRDFENKSEISANGTLIVTFDSPEISSLPEEDRKLINTYWGQSVSSRLFIEDINSNIYKSNTIAFAEGLYQKIIYDRLAQAANNITLS